MSRRTTRQDRQDAIERRAAKQVAETYRTMGFDMCDMGTVASRYKGKAARQIMSAYRQGRG